MKRICFALALLLFCGAFVLMTGCGDNSTAASGNNGTPAKTPADGAAPDTLARIKKDGVLTWGADPSGGAPFVYTDPKHPGQNIGFEIEIMDKLAEHMGIKHKMIEAEWGNLIPDMLAKRTDMVINGVEINEERKKKVTFSEPYYVYEQQLTVRVEDKDKYKTLADLKGKKIGTLSAAEANNVVKRAGFTDDDIVTHPDSLTPYTNLQEKRVDGVVQEFMIADFYAGANSKLYNIPQTFSPGKYGVALRKEDTTLVAEIDRVLKLMKENGELAAIYKKWKMWNGKQGEIGVQEK